LIARIAREIMIRLRGLIEEPAMIRFVTIIPVELWAIVLLLLFMWAAFGLNGFILTVLGVALLQGERFSTRK
jgi:hypothetical protein